MKKLAILILALMVSGCASLASVGSVQETYKGVEFKTDRPAKMTYKKDGAEYTYDSQAPSLLSKIMGALALGAIGAK